MMQPPPQTVPSGTGGPPPVGGPRNLYWSNSPYSRRANVPGTAVAGPVQPVTDPFAFGRQTPQGTALGNPSKGNSLVMQGPSPPMFSQPPGMHVPHTHAGDNSQGLYTSLSGPVSQPGVNTDSFTNVLAPAVPPGHVMNSSAEIHPTAESGMQASSVPSHYNPGAGLENSFGGHIPSGVPPPCRPLSQQDPNGGTPAPTTASFFPQPHQQTPVQWRPVQGSPQSLVQNYSPYIEPPSQNAVPLASGSSHFLPQANMHQVPGYQQHIPLVSTSGHLVGSERNEIVSSQSSNHTANNFQPENMFRQNPGVNSSWPSQDFRQNLGVSKQQLPDPTPVNPIAQGNSLENQPQFRTEAVTSHVLPEMNSGTIPMFFKGEEAENEENISSEKGDPTVKSDFDGFPPNSEHGGHHLPHPMQVGTSVPFQASVPKGSANETTQQGIEAQQYFSQSASNQHDKQTTKNCDIYVNDDKACTVKTCGAIGSQYENVENLECIQNQEVPPSEPLNLNPSSPNDQFRYGPLPGQSVSKHSIVSYAEGGPNLEAPDSVPHPVRSDSVSSSYSSVSHRSVSSSTRLQESVGTFIQQEVGKPNEETSDSFFKQIDSSPLVGETNDNINKSYHSNLSQPPTPSPPKPTGIFQTSANSSFEPVRSHGVGVKPVEADRANMVGELRENHSKQNNSKPNVMVPAASPGNLEQPPDNMETFFTPHTHPLPLTTTDEAVNVLPHGGGTILENVPMASEKRPSRVQGTTKKCESPATTLWAQNELPNFGGNVLLAPAAPALYVPAKAQAPEIIQPPEESRNQDTGRMLQESSIRNSVSEQREEDFGGKFANMAPGRRSRTTSQSSAHMDYSKKCQNTESYKGRERSNSAGQQPSPPPTFASEVKRPTKEVKKDAKEPKKSGESWFSRWLHGKKKTEAYLPDDTNKSIVWDGKKQRWVNLDEPEEENKPPPPPPTSFPKLPQAALPPGPGGPTNTAVNMFSRKAAGTRARYVDVLNPNGTKQSGPVPAPSDLFAPLAPLPIPSNLFVPNSEEQPVENSGLEGQAPDAYQPDPEPAAEPQLLNSATLLPGSENSSSNMDGRQSGEVGYSPPPPSFPNCK